MQYKGEVRKREDFVGIPDRRSNPGIRKDQRGLLHLINYSCRKKQEALPFPARLHEA
jgi:hypothetical protein